MTVKFHFLAQMDKKCKRVNTHQVDDQVLFVCPFLVLGHDYTVQLYTD